MAALPHFKTSMVEPLKKSNFTVKVFIDDTKFDKLFSTEDTLDYLNDNVASINLCEDVKMFKISLDFYVNEDKKFSDYLKDIKTIKYIKLSLHNKLGEILDVLNFNVLESSITSSFDYSSSDIQKITAKFNAESRA